MAQTQEQVTPDNHVGAQIADHGLGLKNEIESMIDKRMLDLKEEMAGRIASDIIEQVRTAASGMYIPPEIQRIMAYPEYGTVHLLIVHESGGLLKAIKAARRYVDPIGDKIPNTYFEFLYTEPCDFAAAGYGHFVDVMVRRE